LSKNEILNTYMKITNKYLNDKDFKNIIIFNFKRKNIKYNKNKNKNKCIGCFEDIDLKNNEDDINENEIDF
jgi:hypothetical protein